MNATGIDLVAEVRAFMAGRLEVSIRDVATAAGWTERSLADACRAGRVSSSRRGNRRAFTADQVLALLQNDRTNAQAPTVEDELAAAIRWNRERIANRGARRVPATAST